jgi:hypothetical protein
MSAPNLTDKVVTQEQIEWLEMLNNLDKKDRRALFHMSVRLLNKPSKKTTVQKGAKA